MKLNIKRKEIPFIVNGLSQVTGMKDTKKSLNIGRDIRTLKAEMEITEDSVKAAKPDNYDQLLSELQELKQNKAAEYKNLKEGEVLNENAITSHVLLTWEKAKEWAQATKEYNERLDAISNETVELDMHTELTDADLPKCADNVQIAEVLSYFMK